MAGGLRAGNGGEHTWAPGPARARLRARGLEPHFCGSCAAGPAEPAPLRLRSPAAVSRPKLLLSSWFLFSFLATFLSEAGRGLPALECAAAA